MKLHELCNILHFRTDLKLIRYSGDDGVECESVDVPEKYEQWFVRYIEGYGNHYIAVTIDKEEQND